MSIEDRNPFEVLNMESVTTKPKTVKKNSIKLVTININSIRGKKLDTQTFLEENKPDIVAIQESKIDSSINTNELIPDELDYDVYRKDRKLGGGGVLRLIKKMFDSMPVNELENDSESIWAKAVINGKTHYISSWYRVPDKESEHILLLKE